MTLSSLLVELEKLFSQMEQQEIICSINQINRLLSSFSPFKSEPINCIQWVSINDVSANDYNPNQVAPPEIRLLYTSLITTGFTQPLVAWQDNNGHYTLIDGFHRFSLAKKRKLLFRRLYGYVPIVAVNHLVEDRPKYIAETIRHNRARGEHQIQAMSSVVLELSRLGWDNIKIGTELGMDADEVLRLKQISGLIDMFQDREFSEAWTVK